VRDNLRTLYAAIEQCFATPLPGFVRVELEGYVELVALSPPGASSAWLSVTGQQLSWGARSLEASTRSVWPTGKQSQLGMAVAVAGVEMLHGGIQCSEGKGRP
jgi:hypothetical protein